MAMEQLIVQLRSEIVSHKKQEQDNKNIILALRKDIAGASARLSDMTGTWRWMVAVCGSSVGDDVLAIFMWRRCPTHCPLIDKKKTVYWESQIFVFIKVSYINV